MFKIQLLNNIASIGLDQFSHDKYEANSDVNSPDALLLRSTDIHKLELPPTLKAVARAGVGVNNIPVKQLTEMGIPVFNTPGANANAVKELVLTGMLLASRNVCQGWEYVNQLTGDDQTITGNVEKNKKRFAGTELSGKVLGVVGLGAIGVMVANAAIALDMKVVGYDPSMKVENAWQLSSLVKRAGSVLELLTKADFVTFHIPLTPSTKSLLNAELIHAMKKSAIVLNFSRHGIVDETAISNAVEQQRLGGYVTDFPSAQLITHPSIICLPHLGASTREAEENCAVMAVNQLSDYLENGNIKNSVNFPEAIMPRNGGPRIAIANTNVPNMVAQMSTCLGDTSINIVDLLNKSRDEVAYTLIDTEGEVTDSVIDLISKIDGVLSVRLL